MQDWFNSLSQRERWMVAGCAAVVVLALVWVLAVQPVLQHAAGLSERVSSKRAQLASLHELAATIQPGGATGPARAATNESVVVIIDRTTRERQLAGYLKRNQPEGSGVRLRLEGAPFDAVVTWLGDLQERYGMQTSSANFDIAGQGRVNASLVISRGAT